jgi:hypothetical protein
VSGRLIEHVPNSFLAGSRRPGTVSEVPLWLPPESWKTLSDALQTAKFTINEDGMLTPFDMIDWEKYVVAQRRNRPTPPIRADVLHNLQSKYDEKTLDEWLFPPVGDIDLLDGMWNSEIRKFVSIYSLKLGHYKF